MLTTEPIGDQGSDPVVRRLSTASARRLAFGLSPVLVGIATSCLLLIDEYLAHAEHLRYVRPYAVVFIIPVLITSLIGGRWPGILSLALSETALGGVLLRSQPTNILTSPRDAAEAVFLAIVGLIVTFSMEAYRSNLVLLGVAHEVQARISAIMGSAPIGIVILNAQGQVQFANAEAERIWGERLRDSTMIQINSRKLYTEFGHAIPLPEQPLYKVMAGDSVTDAREMIFERPDGTRLWVRRPRHYGGRQ